MHSLATATPNHYGSTATATTCPGGCPSTRKSRSVKKQYAHRAGIEGTISLGVRTFDLRRARYLGLAKTHLQPILVACAINLTRLARWIQGEIPVQAHATAFSFSSGSGLMDGFAKKITDKGCTYPLVNHKWITIINYYNIGIDNHINHSFIKTLLFLAKEEIQ